MTAQDYKISISGLLFSIDDEAVLEACYTLLEKHLVSKKSKQKNKPVGYSPTGAPITAEQLEKEVTEAIMRIKGGQGVSQQQLLKQIEEW